MEHEDIVFTPWSSWDNTYLRNLIIQNLLNFNTFTSVVSNSETIFAMIAFVQQPPALSPPYPNIFPILKCQHILLDGFLLFQAMILILLEPFLKCGYREVLSIVLKSLDYLVDNFGLVGSTKKV